MIPIRIFAVKTAILRVVLYVERETDVMKKNKGLVLPVFNEDNEEGRDNCCFDS